MFCQTHLPASRQTTLLALAWTVPRALGGKLSGVVDENKETADVPVNGFPAGDKSLSESGGL
jgi:hypothetical protein